MNGAQDHVRAISELSPKKTITCHPCSFLSIPCSLAPSQVWGYIERRVRGVRDLCYDCDASGGAGNANVEQEEEMENGEGAGAVVKPRVYDIAMLHGHPGGLNVRGSNSNTKRTEKGYTPVPVWDAEYAHMSDVRATSFYVIFDELKKIACS